MVNGTSSPLSGKRKCRKLNVQASERPFFENLQNKGTELFSKLKEKVEKIAEKSKTDKKFATKLKIGATAVVAVVIGLIAISTMDKRVAVNECVIVNVDGYNTSGYVYSCLLDQNTFAKKVLGIDIQEADGSITNLGEKYGNKEGH